MTVHRWFANKECPGEYLFSRHGQIADEVNARLNGDSVEEETPEESASEVGSDGAIVRVGPGENYDVARTFAKAGTYTIVETKDGWGKLKSGAGWVALEDEKTEEKPSEPEKEEEKPVEKPFEPYVVKVIIPNLNIRKGPGTGYDRTGRFTGVGRFTIVDAKNGDGSDSGWGKLKSGMGWISLDYTEKV